MQLYYDMENNYTESLISKESETVSRLFSLFFIMIILTMSMPSKIHFVNFAQEQSDLTAIEISCEPLEVAT